MLGVPTGHKNTIAKVKPEDKLVFYIKQERRNKDILKPKLVGIYEVLSEAYQDSSKIFKSPPHLNEVYPLRKD